MKHNLATVRGPNDTGWQTRHQAAVRTPHQEEYGLVGMLKGWQRYAEEHQRRFESPIGDDGVLGAEWEVIGRALRGLLNGECGRLDCGTVDGWLLEVAAAHNGDIES